MLVMYAKNLREMACSLGYRIVSSRLYKIKVVKILLTEEIPHIFYGNTLMLDMRCEM